MPAIRVNPSEFPLTTRSLVQLLREGRDGDEARLTDEAIANWCFELFSATDHDIIVHEGAPPLAVAQRVAYHVSGQWEADVGNSAGRVLSPELFHLWLVQLGQSDA